MYARVVFFMCDGRQLLDEMNVVLSSLICVVHQGVVALSQNGEWGSISTIISASKIGVLIFVCQ